MQTGRSCSQALQEQYEPEFVAQLTTFKTDGSGGGKTAEFIGFEEHLGKISQIESLRIAVVSGLRVSHGDQSLVSMCPNLVELDVGKSLLSSVDQIASILDHLPTLRTLVLSQNRLGSWDTNRHVFPHVEHLVIAEMHLTTLDNVAKLFPNLITLKVIWFYYFFLIVSHAASISGSSK